MKSCRHTGRGTGLLLLSALALAACDTEPGRTFSNGLFVSPMHPPMTVRIDDGFEYLGQDNFLLGEGGTHGVERHHWVRSEQGEVTAMLVFQFEQILDGVEGQYRFDVPPEQYLAGSNYRFAPGPVRLGDHDYVHNTWAFDTRRSAMENPGKESARTLHLLAAKGLRIDDELIMSRFVRAVGEERRREVIFFYMEPLGRYGHALSEFPDRGPQSDDFDRISAAVDARAAAAFEVLSGR